jgi:hypothetical protein
MSETQEVGRQQLTSQKQISVLVSPTETAKLLHTTAGVLAVWRSTRRYPLKYVRAGRKIFYRLEHIQSFIESRTQNGIIEQHESRSRRGRRTSAA